MDSHEIRNRFLKFFEKRDHSIINSASLIPENDPTVLFNTAGMQPLVPFLMGQPHPQGKRLANSQKCIRTSDIEDIGDNTHATFFEMLGNWSLGDYFKEDAIKWSFDFLTSKEEGLGLDPNRLYVTVFEGNDKVEKDIESFEIWKRAGLPENRIYWKGADTNWWPAVKGKDAWTGPTGPCTEMFYDVTERGLGDLTHEQYLEADEKQWVVEIWNDVFMEYEKKDGQIVSKLKTKNVDTGSGLERVTAVVQKKNNIFETDIFLQIIEKIREISTEKDTRAERIIADHMRASTFLIADGAFPSNSDQGYILRRLIRRSVRFSDVLKMSEGGLIVVVEMIIAKFGEIYKNLVEKKEIIISEIKKEEAKFRKTLAAGIKEFNKISAANISGKDAFTLLSSFGFPIEITAELAKEKGISVDLEGFSAEFEKHQALSRAGAEQKFKGGLGDTGEQSVKYHTATHLLHQALRMVLGDHVSQKGSNITPERLRFDFTHGEKMTDAQKSEVEKIINQKISEGLPVNKIVLPKDEAVKTGALHFFDKKYDDQVSVYYIGNNIDEAFSKEFCGGPHVSNLAELGTFKIEKEEAVSAGVRRIKAVLV